MVSIFVLDDHPLMWLKQALDWPVINAVMIKHWQIRRWGSWVAMAYGIVFAVIGLDVGQGVLRAADVFSFRLVLF
jgi:hypothetical protein